MEPIIGFKNQNNEVQTEELVTAQDNTISLFDENKSNLKDLVNCLRSNQQLKYRSVWP